MAVLGAHGRDAVLEVGQVLERVLLKGHAHDALVGDGKRSHG